MIENHVLSAIRPDWLLQQMQEQYDLNLELAKSFLSTSKAEPDLNNLYLSLHQHAAWLNSLDGEASDTNDKADFYREAVSLMRMLLGEVSRLGGIDPMTEVFNKISFERHLDKLILDVNTISAQRRRSADQSQSNKKQIAVFMIDLDGFKKTNDDIGHAAGDAVLIEVSKILQGVTRHGDFVGRLGGDEFALAVRVENDNEAIRIQERLNSIFNRKKPISEESLTHTIVFGDRSPDQAISDHLDDNYEYTHINYSISDDDKQEKLKEKSWKIDQDGNVIIPIRASIGMVTADLEKDAKHALAAADAYMYKQKRQHHAADPNLKR